MSVSLLTRTALVYAATAPAVTTCPGRVVVFVPPDSPRLRRRRALRAQVGPSYNTRGVLLYSKYKNHKLCYVIINAFPVYILCTNVFLW